MNIFKLEWAWYEDYSHWLFISTYFKSEKEWIDDCNKAINLATEYILKEEKEQIGITDILEKAEHFLLKLGYEKLRTVNFSLFGNYLPHEDDLLREDAGELIKIIGKENYLKICKINKRT